METSSTVTLAQPPSGAASGRTSAIDALTRGVDLDDGALGELHGHAGGDLDVDGRVADGAHGADQAAGRQYLVAGLQGREHLGHRLALLLLRTDPQEVEHRDDDRDVDDGDRVLTAHLEG